MSENKKLKSKGTTLKPGQIIYVKKEDFINVLTGTPGLGMTFHLTKERA